MNAAAASVINTDLLVVGAGINGAGIAADAAGRGLSVVLCDKADFGGATSSTSTKLIHGGLRYLETYQFRLVRESLQEREILLQAAPHIIWPLRFRLPHHRGLRPVWMIRAGLFLYDHLGKRVTLPSSKTLQFSDNDPLRGEFTRGFEYSDCWVDDARLVILNVRRAADHGAVVLPRTACSQLDAVAVVDGQQRHWLAQLKDERTAADITVKARCVVNATGPWVAQAAARLTGERAAKTVRLVKGSHIIVPRLYPGDESYLLQNQDGRVVFVIPYEDGYSLIGTTEEDYQGDPALASISDAEVTYLCDIVNAYFRQGIQPADVLHHYAGVRPLISGDETNARDVSRDYALEFSPTPAPLLSVYGGKITTYRRLAESVLDKLLPVFPDMGKPWTASCPLPGGDFSTQKSLLEQLCQAYPRLPVALLQTWVRRYGTMTFTLLGECQVVEDLGQHFSPGLYQREVDYLLAQEWVTDADDILWRRTKLGLQANKAQQHALQRYLGSVGHK